MLANTLVSPVENLFPGTSLSSRMKGEGGSWTGVDGDNFYGWENRFPCPFPLVELIIRRLVEMTTTSSFKAVTFPFIISFH